MDNLNDIPKFVQPPGWRVSLHLDEAMKMLEMWATSPLYDGLDLNPPFQRDHVWTDDQRSAYMEYLLSGGYSGRDIFFNCPEYRDRRKPKIVLVDGKQRLETIRRFMAGEVRVFGRYLTEWNDHAKVRSWSPDIFFNKHRLKTDEDVMKWYIGLNSGGTPHTVQEIDHVHNLLSRLRET